MNFYMRTVSRTANYKKILDRKTQLDYYTENNSHPGTINLVKLNNKTFGERMQKIIIEMLDLDPPTNSSHDAIKKNMNLKFEIKSSRYWVKTEDFKWQHIMEDHNYDYLILSGLHFDEISLYCISKQNLMKLKENNIISQQGGAEGQGLWFNRRNVLQHLFRVDSKYEFYDFLNIVRD